MPRFNQKTPEGRKGYYLANRDKIRKMQNALYVRQRKEIRELIFKFFDCKCGRCGFSDKRALQVDHVKGGGVKEAKNNNSVTYYRRILNKLLDGSKEYQLLCANCNWIKKSENNEQPYALI
jgi:hypothetical protein